MAPGTSSGVKVALGLAGVALVVAVGVASVGPGRGHLAPAKGPSAASPDAGAARLGPSVDAATDSQGDRGKEPAQPAEGRRAASAAEMLAARRERALRRGTRALGVLRAQSTHSSMALSMIANRFGVRRFGATPVACPDADGHASGAGSQIQAFRRICDPAHIAPVEVIRGLGNGIDRVTAAALHCNHTPLAEDYREQFQRLLTSDDREAAVHTGLALAWLGENGCEIEDRERLESAVASRLQRELDDNADDPSIEAAVFLSLLGRVDLVPERFVELVLDLQRPDGGWPMAGRRAGPDASSHWHTTFLAVWLMLELDREPEGGTLARAGR
jgi:hypothetical protein